MLPITGPTITSMRAPAAGLASFYQERTRYRQRRPYNLALNYFVLTREYNVRRTWDGALSTSATSSFASGSGAWSLADTTSGDPRLSLYISTRDNARNNALRKFNSKRGEKAALAVALAEVSTSISMVTKRAVQLLYALKGVMRFRFGDAAKALGIERDPRWHKLRKSDKLRAEAKATANNWLEFSFGWKPLVSDLYTAMDVLRAPLNYQSPVRARGRSQHQYSIGSGPGKGVDYVTHSLEAYCTVGAVLTVENPNQDLLARLGVTNPFAVVYEIIPWSFVLNWLVNCEEYLSQFNEFYGVSVSNAYYSDKFIDTMNRTYIDSYQPNPLLIWAQLGENTCTSMRRTVGSLPSVRLGVRPAVKMPITRALNAISLLIQQGVRVR